MKEATLLAKEQLAQLSGSPAISCRQTIKNGPNRTVRVPTFECDAADQKRTHTSTSHKSKSTNLQLTMRKPIKIKMFQKDTEKMKVMCFDFPLEGHVQSTEELPEVDTFAGVVVQNINTAYKGLALSKFKMLRNFFTNYQEEKKRVQRQDMNILGLRIKKVDYCNKPKDERAQRSIVTASRRRSSNNVRCDEEVINPTAEFNNESQMTTLHGGSRSELEFPRSESRTECRRTSFMSTQAKSKKAEQKSPKRTLKFSNGEPNKIYEGRIERFQEFVFCMNMVHNVYIEQFDLQDMDAQSGKCDNKNTIWIGPGNNSLLIKSLIKRRFWWSIENDKNLSTVNFVWSQLKDNNLFRRQKASTTQQLHRKLLCEAEDQSEEESPLSKRKHRQPLRSKLNVQDDLRKVMCLQDEAYYRQALQKLNSRKNKRPSIINLKDRLKKILYSKPPSQRLLMHNHLQNNFFLGNKKAMFHNLKQYYELRGDNVFNYLPLTFHIKNGLKDPQYKRFTHYYKRRAAYIKKQENECEQQQDGSRKKKLRNIWIVKPGELSNRGNGITVVDELYEVNSLLSLKNSHANGSPMTYILQLYIDRPMLYNRRKFDIRHYMMISNLHGIVRGYWYSEGYIRTSGYEFDIHNFQRQIHLTNDAVQKECNNYGRYEPANKLSYSQFQRYLDTVYPRKNYSFARHILPKMKQVATDAVKSVALKISPGNLQHNFQIFGLDFMIDQGFRPWLIEINTNPCLELCCPLLSRLIPLMVEQSLRLTLDVVYPPPCHYSNNNKHLVPDLGFAGLKYQLIFDSQLQGQQLQKLYRNVKTSRLLDQIGEISDDEEYADNGVELKIEVL